MEDHVPRGMTFNSAYESVLVAFRQFRHRELEKKTKGLVAYKFKSTF